VDFTEDKVWLCDRLTDLGMPVVEVASFAPPEGRAEHARRRGGVRPHQAQARRRLSRPGADVRGAHRAIEAKVGEMLGLITVSETYTQHNQNMSNEEAIEQNIQSFKLAEREGIPFVMALGMAFWCPYEGLIPDEA
jgi:hydroxymethylglutaryl-CoA lyase